MPSLLPLPLPLPLPLMQNMDKSVTYRNTALQSTLTPGLTPMCWPHD